MKVESHDRTGCSVPEDYLSLEICLRSELGRILGMLVLDQKEDPFEDLLYLGGRSPPLDQVEYQLDVLHN